MCTQYCVCPAPRCQVYGNDVLFILKHARGCQHEADAQSRLENLLPAYKKVLGGHASRAWALRAAQNPPGGTGRRDSYLGSMMTSTVIEALHVQFTEHVPRGGVGSISLSTTWVQQHASTSCHYTLMSGIGCRSCCCS